MNNEEKKTTTEPSLPDGTLIKWPGINQTIYGVVENDGKSTPLVRLESGKKFRLKDIYSSATIIPQSSHTISYK